jgi:hypothetical protein
VSLCSLFRDPKKLPLNRKERFYTATVFPGIVCADKLRGFLSLLQLDEVAVDMIPASSNLQFFSEYDLRDAIRGDCASPWREKLKTNELAMTGDTPDIVILLETPQPLVLMIEAKLFGGEGAAALLSQMRQQHDQVATPLRHILGDCDIRQVALVPDDMVCALRQLEGGFPYSILTWEGLVEAYAHVEGAEYWVGVLGHALNRMGDLKAKPSPHPGYAMAKMTVAAILDAAGKPDCKIRYVGASPATWARLPADIAATTGTGIKISISEAEQKPSPRWMSLEAFLVLTRETWNGTKAAISSAAPSQILSLDAPLRR